MIISEYQLLEASKAGDLELVKKIVNLHPHIVNCRDLDGKISSFLFIFISQKEVHQQSLRLSAESAEQTDSDIPIHHATKVKSRYLDGNICIFFASRVN